LIASNIVRVAKLALLEWEVREIKFRIVKFDRLTAAVAFAGSGVGWHSQWSILILSLVPSHEIYT
jgi:hypothetical protein